MTGISAHVAVLPKGRAFVRFGSAVRLWLLVSAISGAAVALYVFVVSGLGTISDPSLRLPWWTLAVFFYLAEAFVIHLHFRSEAHTLSLNECALVLGLFFVSPE